MFKSLRYVDRKVSTIKDAKDIKKQLSRLAKAWGMTLKECTEYALRMGVNRCLALERHGKLKAKAGKSNGKKAPKRSAKPVKRVAPAKTAKHVKRAAPAKSAKPVKRSAAKPSKPVTLNGAAHA